MLTAIHYLLLLYLKNLMHSFHLKSHCVQLLSCLAKVTAKID